MEVDVPVGAMVNLDIRRINVTWCFRIQNRAYRSYDESQLCEIVSFQIVWPHELQVDR